MSRQSPSDLHARVLADIDAIRTQKTRNGPKNRLPLRWQGCEENPNGYRLLGEMADDMEQLLKLIPVSVLMARQGDET